MKSKTRYVLMLIAAVTLLCSFCMIAQTDPITGGLVSTNNDGSVVTNGHDDAPPESMTPPPAASALQLLVMLLPVIIPPLIVAGWKKWKPHINTFWLPITSAVIGTLLAWIGQVLTDQNINFLVAAALGAASIGLREIVDQGSKVGRTGASIGVWCTMLGGLFIVCSGMTCRPLDPNADPFVVNVERTLIIGRQQVSTMFELDHADRTVGGNFLGTRVPGFHRFVESWRQPLTVVAPTNVIRNGAPLVMDGTNVTAGGVTLPRGYAVLWTLNSVKEDYKKSRASSNAVWTALQTVDSLLVNAGPWLMIATNVPAKVGN